MSHDGRLDDQRALLLFLLIEKKCRTVRDHVMLNSMMIDSIHWMTDQYAVGWSDLSFSNPWSETKFQATKSLNWFSTGAKNNYVLTVMVRVPWNIWREGVWGMICNPKVITTIVNKKRLWSSGSRVFLIGCGKMMRPFEMHKLIWQKEGSRDESYLNRVVWSVSWWCWFVNRISDGV